MDLISDATDRLDEKVDSARQETAAVDDRLDAAVGRLEEQSRRVAVGGARWEALGLFLVGFGLVLQMVA